MNEATQSVTWLSEDETCEIEATLRGRFELDDYGVDRSPTFMSLTEVGVEWPVSIDGADVSREEMVVRIGEEETAHLEEELCGLIKDDAWTADEEDPDYD